jgi:hypothetical protein
MMGGNGGQFSAGRSTAASLINSRTDAWAPQTEGHKGEQRSCSDVEK